MAIRFSHVSGSPVLDLVNTVEWRLDAGERMEDLITYSDVLGWCAESGLISETESHTLNRQAKADPKRAASEHYEVVAVRENAYSAMFEGSADALSYLAERHLAAVAQASLSKEGAAFAWEDLELTLATPRHRIVRSMVDLLTQGDLDRLHQCEDRACGWVYLDTSPRRNRRWCVASDCGDRNRARAYYARNKIGPTSSGQQ